MPWLLTVKHPVTGPRCTVYRASNGPRMRDEPRPKRPGDFAFPFFASAVTFFIIVWVLALFNSAL